MLRQLNFSWLLTLWARPSGRVKVHEVDEEHEVGWDIERLTYAVIGAALRVHSKLGPGMIESVYENALATELRRANINVEQQREVSILLEGRLIPKAYRADLLIEGMLVVEIKCATRITSLDIKQTLTYLRGLRCRIGLILNFKCASMKDGIKRVINDHV